MSAPVIDGPVEVKQADTDLAAAVAGALGKYAVAYEHFTLPDWRTAGRKWRVHETGHGNPFDHGVWLGEFDSKAEANSFCSGLRKQEAEQVAARHRIAAEAASEAGTQELLEALAWLLSGSLDVSGTALILGNDSHEIQARLGNARSLIAKSKGKEA